MTGNGYTTGAALGVSDTVNDLAEVSGYHGLTIAELRTAMPEHHHGTLSGTLSNAHRDGTLALLNERRGRCRIYVKPANVGGRETRPHGRNNRENINA